MKKTNLIVIGVLWMSGVVALAEQTISRDVGGSGNWKAVQVSGHDLWQSEACLAFVKANESKTTLEVYAEKQTGAEAFVEPTVLVVTRGEIGYVRALLNDDKKSGPFHLSLAATKTDPVRLGLMARLDDRAKILAALKKANTASVQLVNEKSKVIKTLNFSLKGSSNTIDGAIKNCPFSL